MSPKSPPICTSPPIIKNYLLNPTLGEILFSYEFSSFSQPCVLINFHLYLQIHSSRSSVLLSSNRPTFCAELAPHPLAFLWVWLIGTLAGREKDQSTSSLSPSCLNTATLSEHPLLHICICFITISSRCFFSPRGGNSFPSVLVFGSNHMLFDFLNLGHTVAGSSFIKTSSNKLSEWNYFSFQHPTNRPDLANAHFLLWAQVQSHLPHF